MTRRCNRWLKACMSPEQSATWPRMLRPNFRNSDWLNNTPANPDGSIRNSFGNFAKIATRYGLAKTTSAASRRRPTPLSAKLKPTRTRKTRRPKSYGVFEIGWILLTSRLSGDGKNKLL